MSTDITCGTRTLDLSCPNIMGVLNVTPDSFSDGGALYQGAVLSHDLLLKRAEQMVLDGAKLLDVGGESTRPGAKPVSESEELDRVLGAVEALTHHVDVLVSVDTSTPSVMTESARLGAGLLNDVRGFRRSGALQAASATGLPVCVMHMQGEPDTMQQNPHYADMMSGIRHFFNERLTACDAAGIARERIILDPGFGFGKTAEHNFHLLAHLGELCAGEQPVLVGLSRKSMIASVLDRAPDERVFASVALALIAVERGASIVRVHDVAATADALAMWGALPRSIDQ
ncbi:dihydropteroate synthase [Luminiphilus sp.]|jgi:dihydropteroate synthase|nr:dihydropteroate synthase [Luminiphilus sp.]